jgi:hypothetical protein
MGGQPSQELMNGSRVWQSVACATGLRAHLDGDGIRQHRKGLFVSGVVAEIDRQVSFVSEVVDDP